MSIPIQGTPLNIPLQDESDDDDGLDPSSSVANDPVHDRSRSPPRGRHAMPDEAAEQNDSLLTNLTQDLNDLIDANLKNEYDEQLVEQRALMTEQHLSEINAVLRSRDEMITEVETRAASRYGQELAYMKNEFAGARAADHHAFGTEMEERVTSMSEQIIQLTGRLTSQHADSSATAAGYEQMTQMLTSEFRDQMNLEVETC